VLPPIERRFEDIRRYPKIKSSSRTRRFGDLVDPILVMRCYCKIQHFAVLLSPKMSRSSTPITKSLYGSITLQTYYFTNLLLYESITVRIYYFTNRLLYESITLQINYFTNLLLYKSVTLQIYYFTNRLLCKSITLRIDYFANLSLYESSILRIYYFKHF